MRATKELIVTILPLSVSTVIIKESSMAVLTSATQCQFRKAVRSLFPAECSPHSKAICQMALCAGAEALAALRRNNP